MDPGYEIVSAEELPRRLDDPEWLEAPVTDGTSPLTVVELGRDRSRWPEVALASTVARVLVGVADAVPDHDGPDPGLDVLLGGGSAERDEWVCTDDVAGALRRLDDTVSGAPRASSALVQLLRSSGGLRVDQAVVAEAGAYSMLLGGSEFRRWLDGRPRRRTMPGVHPVLLEDSGDELLVSLDRPEVHNAFDAGMRDALVDVLRGLVGSPDPRHVVLRGKGPSFCSGGDLGEFGTCPDPPTAAAIRLSRHPGLLLSGLGRRAVARVHGACIGAGAELLAFCSRVEADEGTEVRLPEVGMGLIPGAGGTVSLPRRIGARRTSYLALTGDALGADRARQWGLVDVVTRGASGSP